MSIDSFFKLVSKIYFFILLFLGLFGLFFNIFTIFISEFTVLFLIGFLIISSLAHIFYLNGWDRVHTKFAKVYLWSYTILLTLFLLFFMIIISSNSWDFNWISLLIVLCTSILFVQLFYFLLRDLCLKHIVLFFLVL